MAATAPPAATPQAPRPPACASGRSDLATRRGRRVHPQLPAAVVGGRLRPQLRVRLRKVARHRYAPSSDPFGSSYRRASADDDRDTTAGPAARAIGVSPAVAYYRSLQGGPPDPAPPSTRARALTLGYPAKDARDLERCRGGCRRLELFARSAGVAASALKAAREAGVSGRHARRQGGRGLGARGSEGRSRPGRRWGRRHYARTRFWQMIRTKGKTTNLRPSGEAIEGDHRVEEL